MQKKEKNAFSISKFIQIKAKMEKKESTFVWIFYTCPFLHFKPKNSYKKKTKMQKKKLFFAYVFYKFEKK